jgi:hypothetical protein
VAAVCSAIPALAGSDEENLANQTGDDPTLNAEPAFALKSYGQNVSTGGTERAADKEPAIWASSLIFALAFIEVRIRSR